MCFPLSLWCWRPALVHVQREMESLKEMNGVYHGVMVAILAMSVFNVFFQYQELDSPWRLVASTQNSSLLAIHCWTHAPNTFQYTMVFINVRKHQ